MGQIVIKVLINAVALIAVAYLIPGVHVAGIGAALIAAVVLGVVNAILRPLLVLLSLPLEILTLGLFTFVINAFLFWFVGRFVPGFTVDGFGAALVGSILVSIVSFVLSLVVRAAEGQ
ncbi:MAG TPA: phage holin family protein [Candidatus Baltobacteraceae bacterium]|nr:phage holin family protein [Candidatus Baltobacteraceae bacterium]